MNGTDGPARTEGVDMFARLIRRGMRVEQGSVVTAVRRVGTDVVLSLSDESGSWVLTVGQSDPVDMLPGVHVTTNSVPRDVVPVWELSESELSGLGLTPSEIEGPEPFGEFVRYRGDVLPVSDFEYIGGPDALGWSAAIREAFRGWDGIVSDSHGSGTVVRYVRDDSGTPDPERVVVGRWWSYE